MALYNAYTLKSGDASDPSVWFVALQATPTVQVEGVVPNNGDDLFRILIVKDHVITLDGHYEWADDTATLKTINVTSTTAGVYVLGTIRASRVVDSSLTLLGGIVISPDASVPVVFGYDSGTEADPLLGVSHTLVLNKSSALVQGKYGFSLSSSGTSMAGVSFHGKLRKRNAVLLAGIGVGDISAVVSDATGWEVGDSVMFAPTTTYAAIDVRIILSITPGAGTTATITFAAATNAHLSGAPVGNMSSNVTVKTYSPAHSATMAINIGITGGGLSRKGSLHFENTRFEGVGNTYGMVFIFSSYYYPTAGKVIDPIKRCVFYAATGTGAALLSVYCTQQKLLLSDNAFYGQAATSALSTVTTAYYDADDEYNVVYKIGNSSGHYGLRLSAASSGELLFKVFGSFGVQAVLTDTANFVLRDPIFGPANHTAMVTLSTNAYSLITGGDFGETFGKGNAVTIATPGTQPMAKFYNAKPAPGMGKITTMAAAREEASVYFDSTGGDPTDQEIASAMGIVTRDNLTRNRSASSIRLAIIPSAVAPLTYSIEFLTLSGVSQKIVGYLRKNSSYGSATLPSVTVSGLGITPVKHVMSDVSDTWEQFTLNVTQNSGGDGLLTLTFSGQTAQVGAQCWLDGIPSAPFVTSCRHYGYAFDPTNAVRKIDAVTQTDEVVANSLTGVSIDYTTGTMTINGTNDLREIYDYCHASLCQTSNLVQPEFFTSVDGTNFNCTFDIVLIGEITGVGAVSMPANTLSGSGASAVRITHIGGTSTSLIVSGITPGSRLRIHDGTSEWCNEIVTGTSFVQSRTWSINKTLDVRLTYCSGVSAKLPWQQTAIFGVGGVSILANQIDDSVYATNAVDGSTVTEFTPDYANVQVDVGDADGVTTAQRLYAWMTYNSTLPAGIAAYFEAVQADDAVNYRITVALLNLHIQNAGSNAVVIAGARLYRDDGTSIFAPGNGPIQLEPGKAYVAGAAGIAEAVVVAVVAGLAIPTASQNAAAVALVVPTIEEIAAVSGGAGGASSAEVADAVVAALDIPTVADIAAGVVVPTAAQNAAAVSAALDVPTVQDIAAAISVPTASQNAAAAAAAISVPTASQVATEVMGRIAGVVISADVKKVNGVTIIGNGSTTEFQV